MKFILLGAFLTAGTVLAGTRVEPSEHTEECCELNLWTGEGVSIGNWFFPEINYLAAAGSSTIDPARLAVGHHDPDRHGITQQAFEVAATIRLGEHLSLFGTYSGKVDLNDHWLSEFEEYYAIIELPGDVRIRGGRFQPRIGYQNDQHIHDYTFIDQYLANGRMFGEDPLVVYGGEITLPVLRKLPAGWDDRLTVSFGAVPDPDAEEHEHEHEDEEPLFEGEGASFADWAASVDYTLGYNASPSRRYEIGVSGVWGGNEFGRTTQIYGLHGEILWKPGGVEPEDGAHHHDHGDTSEFLRWRTEVFVRHFGGVRDEEFEEVTRMTVPSTSAITRQFRQLRGIRVVQGPGGIPIRVPVYSVETEVVQPANPAHEEEHREASVREIRDEFMDAGIYTALTYGFPGGKVQTHLRAEYVTGVSDAGLPERWRISPAIAWHPSERLPVHFKLQYNYDHSPSFGSEHSIWAQISVTWGDCCAH